MGTFKQRKLERIENAFGSDLVCTLHCKSGSYQCGVVDYNALGFRLSCEDLNKFSEITLAEIESAKIHYGTFLLGEMTFPKVARALATANKFVLIPTPRSSVDLVDRPRRADVPYLLEPLLVGPDPIRLREQLIFRIENISSRGFRAKTSLSNKHLMLGMQLDGFSITLPSMGTFECSFKISNTRVEAGYLIIGCEFVAVSQSLSASITDFLLLCSLIDGKPTTLQRKTLPKVTTSLLRVRRIDQLHEMNRVMELRFSAYSGANKLIENATVDDMADAHDKRSVILGAFIGPKIVGTVRIVFSRDGSPFPFEERFTFPKGYHREACTEISKMAIDPDYQGTDVVFRLFQSVALEFIPKCEHALLMSTSGLARNYVSLGATKLTESVPHPVLKNEVLNLYVLETKKIKAARMSAVAWIFFVREMVDFLSRFGFARKTKTPVLKLVKAPLELSAKKARKIFRRRVNK